MCQEYEFLVPPNNNVAESGYFKNRVVFDLKTTENGFSNIRSRSLQLCWCQDFIASTEFEKSITLSQLKVGWRSELKEKYDYPDEKKKTNVYRH